jgi:endonuclease/exonuclease/phosphatase family metal-dependent hydrolase
MALVTAAVFVTLVAVGVGYVVHSDDTRDATLVDSAALPSSGRTSTAPAAPQSAPVLPAYHAPGVPVTMTARPTPTKKPKPKPKHKDKKPATKKAPPPPPELDFTLTTFNVLGASHTRHHGRGMASGGVRAGRAAAILSRHGTDVAGFQELQSSQLAVLQRHTGMDFYPGFSMGHLNAENSIGWRRDAWVAVEKHTIGIPYFNGHRRQMPFVKLRSLSTGLEAWFINVHNPADTNQYHHQQRWRDRATGLEVALANNLIRHDDGVPVFLTGDMNERAEYFCRLTGSTPMIAARGGSHVGGCQAGRPRAVDWIFGSQGVDFTGYFEDRSHLVDITTDHPVVSARVHLVGEAPAGSLGTAD